MSSTHAQSPRRGVLTAGLWLIDYTKQIDRYPEPSRLATISEVTPSNGGGAFNLLVNLAKLGATFPLRGLGLLGDDTHGRWIRDRCDTHHIDHSGLRTLENVSTSFTDVMTETGSGRRTFFYQPGANDRLAREHIDFRGATEKWFYLGYPGLLPHLDPPERDGRSGISHVLEAARTAGLSTAVDFVSADHAHWASHGEALRHVDLLFVNEWEAARLLQSPTPADAELTSTQLLHFARQLLARGVTRAVVVHAPAGAVLVARDGCELALGAVAVPPADVRGTCGAGDALAAGVLLGVHEGRGWRDCLELGLCAAALCVRDLTTSEGIRPAAECLAYGRQLGHRVWA